MLTPRTIGTYELEGLLGEGGIGQVYAAQDKVLGRPVAIKMLRPELSRDSNFVDRFHIEAKSLGNLNHSNITTLYALHAEGDDAFMVMELVHGNTLEALLNRVHRLTLRDSLAVLAQTVAGIRYAHRRGVIHRDIKPANLMLTDDGVVKIMDFGIARVRGSQHLTQVGEFCGTFVYASPEQIRGEEVDERSDLYSLAIVFYRMLAGTAPFTSDNEYALMTAQLQAPPPPLAGRVPDLDAATEAVLMRALAKRPEDRFASVEEFGRSVGAMALRGESIDILQQLYARAFGSEDLEATRIMTAVRPAAVQPTMPSHPPNGRGHDEWELPPSLPGAEPASAEPWSGRPPRQSAAPSPQGSNWPSASPPNERAARRPWLIGAAALAVPLLLGGGYYLFAPRGAITSHSSSTPLQVAAADATPAPSPSPVPTPSPPEPPEAIKADPQLPAATPPGPDAAATADPQPPATSPP
ncbi:MAG: protein kinase, partial [Stellaceae bacterium]